MFRADANNRGKVCERGLWAYSRHPNYFFEWFHWLSYIFLAVGSPLFIISPLSAILVLFLILKVTGIPPTEERAIQSRGDAYRDYQRRVSAFVPWFRRS
jgi:steroid 5-alpha reductase family enzyme